MQKKGAIILQARMNSARLPGKVLKDLLGKPILKHIVDHLSNNQSNLKVILATSDQATDDPVEKYCNDNAIEVFRGDLDNVAKRFVDCINKYSLDFFVRICADSPLSNTQILDQLVDTFLKKNCTLVCNTFPRSFPKGLSAEVLCAKDFIVSYDNFEGDECEHITQFFYKQAVKFNVINLRSANNYSDINLSIDTQEDFDRIEAFMKSINEDIHRLTYKELMNSYNSFIKNY